FFSSLRHDLIAEWWQPEISATAWWALAQDATPTMHADDRESKRMSYETIIVETRGRVGIIRLNRPQALNALNSVLNAELAQAFVASAADNAIGCMLLPGSDRACAAGADIKEMADKSSVDVFMGDFAGAWHATANARKPVVAAVAGFALGGGCELVMQCDVVIAADTAKFGQPEITLGIIP